MAISSSNSGLAPVQGVDGSRSRTPTLQERQAQRETKRSPHLVVPGRPVKTTDASDDKAGSRGNGTGDDLTGSLIDIRA